MRVLGEELRKAWGQAVILENRPGGGLNVGGRYCAEARPDGYTICILPVETLTYNEFMYRSIPFKPARDFVQIANPFFDTEVLVVNSNLKVKTLPELAALSKAKPKELSYVTPSVSLYVFMEHWKKQTGADMVWIPFRGGSEVTNNLLSGVTPVAFFGLPNMIYPRRQADGDRRRQRQALAAPAQCADAARARLQGPADAGLFRHRRA